MRKVSQEGREFLKRWEGRAIHGQGKYKCTPKCAKPCPNVGKHQAYLCSAGVLTIGYGHTEGVKPTHFITEHQAETLFEHDISIAEEWVESLAPLANDNQFAALVSFVHNFGPAAYAGSTLCKHVAAGRMLRAAEEFPKWKYERDRKTGQMRENAGLLNRRLAEKTLFLKHMGSV